MIQRVDNRDVANTWQAMQMQLICRVRLLTKIGRSFDGGDVSEMMDWIGEKREDKLQSFFYD